MTRSTQQRRTGNARRIAAAISLSSLIRSIDHHGPFQDGDSARRWVEPVADPDLLDDVHWPVLAEAPNVRYWRAGR